jgi:hypothetical protein
VDDAATLKAGYNATYAALHKPFERLWNRLICFRTRCAAGAGKPAYGAGQGVARARPPPCGQHFLGLEASDRLLRFGSMLPDEQVENYANGIDFARDMVFGVYNRMFKLVAVGHLAFARATKAAP